jgi:hypothetical protein
MFIFFPNVKALDDVCSVSSDSTEIKPGDIVLVDFYIHDIGDLEINKGYVELGYDNNVFEYIGVTSLYQGFNYNVEDKEGKIALSLISDSGYISNISGNVVMATLQFKVKDDAENQSTKIVMYGLSSAYINDTLGENNSCKVSGSVNLNYSVYDNIGDATLSYVGVNYGSLEPTFSKDVTSYNVDVVNGVKSIAVSGKCNVAGCKIEGGGSYQLSVGKNNINIKVTSPNGKKSTIYKIVVNREKKVDSSTNDYVKDSNTNLKSLTVSEGELSPKFSSGILEYTVDVDSDVESVKIGGVCAGTECTVSGTGVKHLSYGENNYEIKVTAEDGQEKIYSICVKRAYYLRLSSLIIDNYSLNRSFDKDIFDYEIEVGEDVDNLNIRVEASSSDVDVSIIGNNNFSYGRNIVKINLSYKDSDETNTYTIVVNKKVFEDSSTVVIDKDNNSGIWDNGYVVKLGIVFGVVIVLLIGGFIVYLMKKRSKRTIE